MNDAKYGYLVKKLVFQEFPHRKRATIFGAVMGLFTVPWLLPVIPYKFDWVV